MKRNISIPPNFLQNHPLSQSLLCPKLYIKLEVSPGSQCKAYLEPCLSRFYKHRELPKVFFIFTFGH